MPGKEGFGDRLAGYVEVKDRIAIFYEKHPDGRLVTEHVKEFMDPVSQDWYIAVEAAAYRTVDDPLPGRGWSWMRVPGSTSFTKGSELENTETSAWGRAIGSLGIGIAGGIASAQEVRNKEGETAEPPREVGQETLELLGRIEKRGVVVAGGSAAYKGDWRETPDGHVIGFRLQLPDRDIPQVLVNGPVGDALFAAAPALLGETVTVKGHLYAVKVPSRKAYHRLIVGERPADFIETADFRIPPKALDPEAEVIPVAEGQETLPL